MSDLTIQQPLRLFYSYSHKDEALRQRLETHLKLLQRQTVIEGWHDRVIDAGQEWAPEIKKRLDEADIILLLVSTDFLASDYCWGVEMQQALQRHQGGTTRVIPIILRPTDLTGAPFMHLQCLPKDAKPVITWTIEDEAWTNVAQGIRRVATTLRHGTAVEVAAGIASGQPSTVVSQPPSDSQTLLPPAARRIRLIQETKLSRQRDLSMPQIEDLLYSNLQGLPAIIGLNNNFFKKSPLLGLRNPLKGPTENQQGGLIFSVEHDMNNRKPLQYHIELNRDGILRLAEYIDDHDVEMPILNIRYIALRVAIFTIFSIRLDRRRPLNSPSFRRHMLHEIAGVTCKVDDWAVTEVFPGITAGIGLIQAANDLLAAETGWMPMGGPHDGLSNIAPLVAAVLRELFYKFRSGNTARLGLVRPTDAQLQEALSRAYETLI